MRFQRTKKSKNKKPNWQLGNENLALNFLVLTKLNNLK